jgi:hypothetical protein
LANNFSGRVENSHYEVQQHEKFQFNIQNFKHQFNFEGWKPRISQIGHHPEDTFKNPEPLKTVELLGVQ